MNASLQTLDTVETSRTLTPLQEVQGHFDRAAVDRVARVCRERGGCDMNLYAMLSSGIGTTDAASLSTRLAAWHDAMVAHERRLRSRRTSDACDDECPHVEARTLWAEALETFGPRANELAFLRSRALADSDRVASGAGRPRSFARSSDQSPTPSSEV